MYEILKKLLPVAEGIGSIATVHQNIRDRKYYSSDEIKINGTTPDGRNFTLRLELEDEENDS